MRSVCKSKEVICVLSHEEKVRRIMAHEYSDVIIELSEEIFSMLGCKSGDEANELVRKLSKGKYEYEDIQLSIMEYIDMIVAELLSCMVREEHVEKLRSIVESEFTSDMLEHTLDSCKIDKELSELNVEDWKKVVKYVMSVNEIEGEDISGIKGKMYVTLVKK